jgi:GNAT superfamily N-acetyltransferase
MMLSDAELTQIKRFCFKKLLSYSVHQDQFRMIPGDLSFSEYQATRSASFNRNQRRCQRIVEKAGFPITHEMTIEEILSIYERRHSQRGEEDYSVTDQFKRFLTELRNAMQAEGRWYEVGIRNDQGHLAAFALGFWDQNKVFYLFQTGHDPEYRSMRLGGVVFEKLIEDILTRGCSYLSFASDASYLQLYSDRVYRFNRIDIYGQTPRGFLLLLRRLGAIAKEQFKSFARPRLQTQVSQPVEGALPA